VSTFAKTPLKLNTVQLRRQSEFFLTNRQGRQGREGREEREEREEREGRNA
jgi:hypothetical protein